MNTFSISDLAMYSGIKPHTIRIWEQRYDTLKPERTEGNTRYYTNSHLRRLLNIVTLSEAGFKVSELSGFSDRHLYSLVEELKLKPGEEDAGSFIYQLIASAITYDAAHFTATFSHCLLKYGMRKTYLKVLYPTLERIGLLWSCDKIPPAREHFISHLIRQKLLTAIDALPPPVSKEKWLLFLPEDEFHESGLLYAHYLLLASGRQSIYIGANMPYDSLLAAIKETAPDNLLMFLVHNTLPDDIRQYLSRLRNATKREIYVACKPDAVASVKLPSKIHLLHSAEALEMLLPEKPV